MEQEDKEEEFQGLWRERQRKLRGIIAVIGPPDTMKTHLAQRIGRWAKCGVLCIQDFLSPVVPSDEEVVQHAFTNLCKVAHRHLDLDVSYESWGYPNFTVVIKSRLNSTFELQHLLDLVITSGTPSRRPKYPLLIIECRFTNEYLWKHHFEKVRNWPYKEARDWSKEKYCSWYRPGSWNEMEKARNDYYHHPQSQSQPNWDLHLQQLIFNASTDDHDPIIVRRLVVDPIDIFSFSKVFLPNDFSDAIKYLLTTRQGELINISKHAYNYTVEYCELRPHLFEKRLRAILAAKGRSNYLCPSGECIFKYSEAIEQLIDVCGVCGKQVDSGTPAYTCRLCILTLHKSCAEKIHFKALRFDWKLLLRTAAWFHQLMPEKHACKSCVDGGKGFSYGCGSCNFQTHLKCGLIPTIINHNSHRPPHFLSLLVNNQEYRCRACGTDTNDFSYSCKPCGWYYHLKCALLPLELLKHEHGGHEHVMKLIYSHHGTDDDMEPEESYWCEVCYEDMDPQVWLYSCKDCPYYSAHLHCARGYEYLGNVKNTKFVGQIQSQLEDAMAEVNADSEVRDKE